MNWSEIFNYCPESGLLTWAVRRQGAKIGEEAGCKTTKGYRQVKFDGKCFLVHRIVWEMNFGPIASGMEVDHENHKRDDNRLSNLRVVQHIDNQMNQSKHSRNSSGVTGVSFNRWRNVWTAQIRKKTVYYGDSFFDAVAARKAAEKELKFHKNHGA